MYAEFIKDHVSGIKKGEIKELEGIHYVRMNENEYVKESSKEDYEKSLKKVKK